MNTMLKVSPKYFKLGDNLVLHSINEATSGEIVTALHSDQTYQLLDDDHLKCVKTGANVIWPGGKIARVDIYMYNNDFFVKSSELCRSTD